MKENRNSFITSFAMKNIQSVSDAFMCSNCGACKAICPKDAISFESNSLGRMYAIVNNQCIDCGLCVKVCPSLDKHELHKIFQDRYIGVIRKVYVGKSADEYYYKNAQSGGACITILDYLFKTKAIDCAVVCKMYYGKSPIVQAVLLDSGEQLGEYQKSCYTPVDLLSILKNTNGKGSVALVGLPCHIQGLESLMRLSNKFSNIKFRIGLICDRTLCGGIQDVMMSYHNEGRAKIIWRKKDFYIGNKYYPYKTAPVTVVYENGKEYVIPNCHRFALKDFFTPPRCRVCYDKLNSFSDIVLGDPWGMSKIDWQKGESVVVVRTRIGEQLIDEIVAAERLVLSERNVVELLSGQRIEERRRQIGAYSRALKVIPMKINSYLYTQEDKMHLSTKEISLAQKEIKKFIVRDKKDKKKLIREARLIIMMVKTMKYIDNFLIVKTLRKIEQLFR